MAPEQEVEQVQGAPHAPWRSSDWWLTGWRCLLSVPALTLAAVALACWPLALGLLIGLAERHGS